MDRIAGWWDEFELWIAGLPFIPQFILVMVLTVPLALAIATGLDRGLDALLRVLGRGSDQ
ncbi:MULTISPECIES: hypothetical protein [Antrihabitans]|uniref:Uncharacterized protein n=2 Tax=Antrihabitans TaxID=2799491 RepID=A0A934NW04_9NOCA|nr:hypothetical protein [Antrihabitans stalagmiti]MBJ8342304.1 hypothetical protein [Antrihabitans stalagmiti]